MWFWHVPALYDAALEHASVHVLEHVMFLSAGLLYWWHLLSPIRSRLLTGIMGPVVYMLSTKFAVGLLGIGLTFTPDPLYDYYEQRAPIWGLTRGRRPGARRRDHGPRAVDRDGHRARLPVRPRARAERARAARAASGSRTCARPRLSGRVSRRARCRPPGRPDPRRRRSSTAPRTMTPRAEADVAAHRQRVARDAATAARPGSAPRSRRSA